MDQLNMNQILNREETAREMRQFLLDFEKNKKQLQIKRGIYVYGEPGTGKTTFVVQLLKEMGYDVIKYDAGDIRNTQVIENIAKQNMSNQNILSIFRKQVQHIAIVMDEIDGMNSGDKGGIKSLIKLIRPKKTNKQMLDKISMIPIICISNYRINKKIKDLMKVCNNIELKPITPVHIDNIIRLLMPTTVNAEFRTQLVAFVQCDLRRLQQLYGYYKNNTELFVPETIQHILQIKTHDNSTKKITASLLKDPYLFEQHNVLINEPDRTSIGLLWHENIIDVIEHMDKKESIPFYLSQLNNICFSDYIDRVTFQKQIWHFNEMSSLIKTFHNNKKYHDARIGNPSFALKKPITDIRFTKVLTKYSTEFNNYNFIQKMCQTLGMDKKDLIDFFIIHANDMDTLFEKHQSFFEKNKIKKKDIIRIYRYIDKYTKENASGMTDKKIEDYEDDEDDGEDVSDNDDMDE
jgi:hypothetical protein